MKEILMQLGLNLVFAVAIVCLFCLALEMIEERKWKRIQREIERDAERDQMIKEMARLLEKFHQMSSKMPQPKPDDVDEITRRKRNENDN